MGGGLGHLDDRYLEKKPYHAVKERPTFYGNRRLSKVKSRHFSTWNGAYQGNLVNTSDSGISLPSRLHFIPNLATAFNPFRQQ